MSALSRRALSPSRVLGCLAVGCSCLCACDGQPPSGSCVAGDSLLQIDVMDHDIAALPAADDLIGSTTIDLEDRVFSPYWANVLADAPPVEWRSLYSPLSKHEQGKISLWVDILRAERAKAVPRLDISLAPPKHWELRVIVWSGMDLPTNVDDSGLADWYITCRFAECPKQHSDVSAHAVELTRAFDPGLRMRWTCACADARTPAYVPRAPARVPRGCLACLHGARIGHTVRLARPTIPKGLPCRPDRRRIRARGGRRTSARPRARLRGIGASSSQ